MDKTISVRDCAVRDCREAIVYLNQKAHEMAYHLPVNYEMCLRTVSLFTRFKEFVLMFEDIENKLKETSKEETEVKA